MEGRFALGREAFGRDIEGRLPPPPPPIDGRFLMPSESRFRVSDLAALGWSEADLFGAFAADNARRSSK